MDIPGTPLPTLGRFTSLASATPHPPKNNILGSIAPSDAPIEEDASRPSRPPETQFGRGPSRREGAGFAISDRALRVDQGSEGSATVPAQGPGRPASPGRRRARFVGRPSTSLALGGSPAIMRGRSSGGREGRGSRGPRGVRRRIRSCSFHRLGGSPGVFELAKTPRNISLVHER